jgi:DNA-directed RNA polymerase specialized sigma24 family protein
MAAPHVTTAVRDRCFDTTHWSVVLAARSGESTQSRLALEKLCRAYWEPLFGYIQRRGYTLEDAKDLTQEFFLRLSAPDFLASVSSDKGKFRSFLLASLNHFLANEWHRASAQKRGGNAPHLSLDAEIGEGRPNEEPASVETPEAFFDKRWALTILERALAALRQDFAGSGKSAQFDALKPYLTDASAAPDYERAAAQLQMKPDSVAVAVHRLRKRYRELVRSEVAQTVQSQAELEGEMSYLLSVLGR